MLTFCHNAFRVWLFKNSIIKYILANVTSIRNSSVCLNVGMTEIQQQLKWILLSSFVANFDVIGNCFVTVVVAVVFVAFVAR